MRTWNQLVTEGKRAVRTEGDQKWLLGDLALEVAPMAEQGKSNDAFALLQEYADEIDVPFETLRAYRKVASAFPKHRGKASWTVYLELAYREDRLEVLLNPPKGAKKWTTGLVRDHLGKKMKHGLPSTASPAQKVEQAKALLSDPDVAAAVVYDPGTAAAIAKANLGKHQFAKSLSKGVVGDNTMEAVYVVAGRLAAARRGIAQSLQELQAIHVDEDHAAMLLENAEEVGLALGWLTSYLRSGEKSWDDSLARLLKEG